MNIVRLGVIALCGAVLMGCAVGNKYSYETANVALPFTGEGEIGVAVVDNRSYVLDGSKDASFVGVQRAALGNAWSVTTESGKPLTEAMATPLERGLSKSGFAVTPLAIGSPADVQAGVAAGGKDKNVVLTVNDWQTDIYMKLTLAYDLLLQIVSGDGETLAENSMRGDEVIGGTGFETQNSENSAAAYETKIGRLFNSDEIKAALLD